MNLLCWAETLQRQKGGGSMFTSKCEEKNKHFSFRLFSKRVILKPGSPCNCRQTREELLFSSFRSGNNRAADKQSMVSGFLLWTRICINECSTEVLCNFKCGIINVSLNFLIYRAHNENYASLDVSYYICILWTLSSVETRHKKCHYALVDY